MIEIVTDIDPPFQSKVWKPFVKRDDDGKITSIYTGWINKGKPGEVDAYDKWEKTDHFVFRATIQSGGCYQGRSAAGMYAVIKGIGPLRMNLDSTARVLVGLTDGTHIADEDGIHGLWTLTKKGQNIFITPLRYDQH